MYIYTCIYTEPARLCNRNTLLESRPFGLPTHDRAPFLWTYKRRNIVGLSRQPVMTLYVYYNIQYRQINLLIMCIMQCIMCNIITYICNYSLYIVHDSRVLISDIHWSFFMPSKKIFVILQRQYLLHYNYYIYIYII